MRVAALSLLAACTGPSGLDDRARHVVDVLAEDNYLWAVREPDAVAMKLAKMQRDPFDWLRGTPAIYWRDVMTPGTARATTKFGDPASSRVLLVADPHIENVGTFRAGDGTMVVDWNDFDSSGYGPYEVDVRRLAASLIVATMNDASAADLAHEVGVGYAAQMAALAAGQPAAAVGAGAEPYFDTLIAKAQKKGDARADLEEVAPVTNGVRAIAFGDVDPVGPDGVIEKRYVPVDANAAAWIDDVVAAWSAGIARDVGTIKLRARRLGQGVSSYAALRYDIVLEGPTAAVDDDIMIELKEERDGIAILGVPMLDAAEWSSPGRRVADAERRLQAVRDSDVLVGAGEATPLSLFVHEETAYQRGVTSADVPALPADQQRALAHRLGEMLARAHGEALTQDGVQGWRVIAPLIGDGAAFADEVSAFAVADAAQVMADWTSLKDRELAALVLP
jgi:uncharacterized protein (DUF2252 family)